MSQSDGIGGASLMTHSSHSRLEFPVHMMGHFVAPKSVTIDVRDTRVGTVKKAEFRGRQIDFNQQADPDVPTRFHGRECQRTVAGISYNRDVPDGQHAEDVREVLSALGVFQTIDL